MSELIIAGRSRAPTSLNAHKYMRKTLGGKIKTTAKSKSSTAVKLTIFILVGIGYDLWMAGNFYFDLHELGFITYIIIAAVIVLEMAATKVKAKVR